MGVALSAFSEGAWAKQPVPLPKPRPSGRSTAPHASVPPLSKTTAAPAPVMRAVTPARFEVPSASVPARPAVLTPAPRQHAALPPVRKVPPQAAVAATSSTSQADAAAVENVIELVRKHDAAGATQAEAAIGDPVARKLAVIMQQMWTTGEAFRWSSEAAKGKPTAA